MYGNKYLEAGRFEFVLMSTYTINAPPAPPPQQFSNVATLINGQADVVGVMLFIRFANPSGAALPGQGLPGGILPGFNPAVSAPRSALLVDGVDYTRNGGIITMTAPPPVGSLLVAQVFAKGKQLGGSNPYRYIAPWSLNVQGAYDGASLAYKIVFGPTISGGVDGVNALFLIGASVARLQVFRNGLLQTINQDVVSGPTAIVFLPGAIPQPGDVITALAFGYQT